MAPDGALTPRHTRASRPSQPRRSICGAACGNTDLTPRPTGVQADGGLLVGYSGAVMQVRPDGAARRVLLGHKLGKSPAGAQLDGVNAPAVDPQRRIPIGSRRMENDQLAVLRVDEARGMVVPVAGAALIAGASLVDTPPDGPVERARFVRLQDQCVAPDGTLYGLDKVLLRRIDRAGQLSTWAF